MNILFEDRQNIEIEDNILSMMIDVIQKTLEEERISLDKEVSISFVDNSEIQKLNKEYRGIDSETDVLSFPLEFQFQIEGEDTPLGDIIISVEKAREQAIEFDHSLLREMVYLTIHSMLHLLGYDHLDEESKSLMREKEKAIVRSVGIYKRNN